MITNDGYGAEYWIRPVPGHNEITSGVGPRWGTTHSGIDISAPMGVEVIAANSGKVTIAEAKCPHNHGKSDVTSENRDKCGGGYGNYIEIDHGSGMKSRYAHLSKLAVNSGDPVQRGQVIGTIGSTGNSTGPHLHFEIIEDGVKKDPENYVSPDNNGFGLSRYEASRTLYSDTSAREGTYVDKVPYTPLTIVGERTRDEAPLGSMYAYVNIYIGGQLLSPTPNIFQRFEMDRITGVGDTARFTIYDDNWDEIEQLFAANWTNVELEYGYLNSSLKSKRYSLMLADYSIDFETSGVWMNVTAISTSIVANLDQRTITTNTKNPTEATKIICRELGFTVLDENFEATNDVTDRADPYTVLNDNPITYILETIIPESRTLEGETIEFHVDDDNVVHFRSESYNIEKTNKSNIVKTYIYMKGYDSPVISIEFDIGGVFGGTGKFDTSSGAKTSTIDPTTKQQNSEKQNTQSVASTIITSGQYTHMDPNQAIISQDSAGMSSTQVKNTLFYSAKKAMTRHYQAKLTIVGDPTLSLLEDIRIINVTDSGKLHHTSGIYKISGILDTVEKGQMLTTLDIFRNGDINEGVELLSSRATAK